MSALGKVAKKLYHGTLNIARNPTDSFTSLIKGKSITDDPHRNRKQAKRRSLAYGTILDGSVTPIASNYGGKSLG